MLSKYSRPAFFFTTPWLLAAAAGLLILIVVTFAFHNLRLERRLMTDVLVQKAATLIQVLHSGSRASYLNDLRRDYWNNEAWGVHVQRVIDHLAEDSDLRFLALVDAQGKAIAHSDHARVGQSIPITLPEAGKESKSETPPMRYQILAGSEYGRVFEAVRPFVPAIPTMMPMWPLHEGGPGRHRMFLHDQDDRRSMMRPVPEMGKAGERYYVIAGLDMKEYDRTLGRLQMQIMMLSLAMLLVGLGGWLSLSAVQGYRVSQKTLDEMQAYTSLLIAKLPVGVIATDAQGRITTWNEAVAGLTGVVKGAAMGREPRELLPEALAAFFSGEGGGDGKGPRQDRDASLRLALAHRRCELLCHPLVITDSQQQYLGRVLLISDVTEIRSLEQRMRESERLAAIGRMAGGVAHEVRNPLSSIKGLALLLKNKFAEGSRERDTADLLIQETERMNRTITEMLSFTRPATLRLSPVDMAALLRRCLELVKAEAADGGVVADLAVPANLPAIQADADRLQQVLMNVLLNGLQAMDQGGRLTVTAAPADSGQSVEIRIADTGKGIPPELLSQVFFPYFTTRQGGSGIGLAISQKIVTDHQGTIEVESEPGQGTTVVIRLPVRQSETAARPENGAAGDPV